MVVLLCGELNFNLKIILNTTKGKKVFLIKENWGFDSIDEYKIKKQSSNDSNHYMITYFLHISIKQIYKPRIMCIENHYILNAHFYC